MQKAVIETDKSGQEYFDVLLSESPDDFLTQEDLLFHIDENMALNTPDTRFIRYGNYNYDSELAPHGGYRIYVDRK